MMSVPDRPPGGAHQAAIHLVDDIARDVATDAEFARNLDEYVSGNDVNAKNAGGAKNEPSQPSQLQPPHVQAAQEPGSKGNKAGCKAGSKQTKLPPAAEL